MTEVIGKILASAFVTGLISCLALTFYEVENPYRAVPRLWSIATAVLISGPVIILIYWLIWSAF